MTIAIGESSGSCEYILFDNKKTAFGIIECCFFVYKTKSF